MGVKKYIGFAILFLAIVGLYVYNFETRMYRLNVLDYSITLPIAVWMILPAAVLFLLTILHFMFYGVKGYVKTRAIKKDSDLLTQNAKNALLGKDVAIEYKTDFFQLPGSAVYLLNIDPKKIDLKKVHDEDLLDIMDAKKRVSDGEIVNLSRFSLDIDNPIVIQNEYNKLAADKMYAANILKNAKDEKLREKAYLEFATFASKSDLDRYKIKPTKELFFILVDRINAEKYPLDLSDEDIIEYLKKIEFDKDDLIKLAKKLKTKMNPDRLMLLFQKLSNEFPHRANEAYLYVLFEFQMMDNAREFLENTAENEFLKFKYMLFLKDNGKNFDTELFV